jgi:hypothetical protein
MTFYRVTFKDITAGIEVSPDGVITSAAPIFKKSVGMKFVKFREWLLKKGGKIQPLGRETE